MTDVRGSEIGPELPDGWEWRRLRDVADVLRGVSYKKTQVGTPGSSSHVPLLRATNIVDDALVLDDFVWIPRDLVKDEQMVRSGDLVVAASSGSLSVVGKAAPVPDGFTGTFGAFCAVVRPDVDAIEPRYLRWFMASDAYRQRVSALAAGSNINNLRRNHLLDTPLPVPPLPEQRQAASGIEKLIEILGDGTEALTNAVQRTRDLAEAIIEHAVWRSTIPATEHLSSQVLAQERRDAFDVDLARGRRRGSYKQPVMARSAGDERGARSLYSLDELAAFVTDGDHNPPKRQPRGIPHLTAKHIRDYAVNLDDSTFISTSDFERVAKRYRPEPRDVIVTCVGTIGRVAVVTDEGVFSPDRNLAAVRPLPSVEPLYVMYALASPSIQRQMARASGSTAQPHLYLGDLRALEIPLPSPSWQRAIVSQIEAGLGRVSALLAALDRQQRWASQLRRVLLRDLFAGCLTTEKIA